MIFRSDFIAAERPPHVRTVEPRPAERGSPRFVGVLIGSLVLHGIAFVAFGEIDPPMAVASAPAIVSFEATFEPIAEPEPEPIVEPEPERIVEPEPIVAPEPERIVERSATSEPNDATDLEPTPADAPPSQGIASHEGGMATDLPSGNGSGSGPIAHDPAPPAVAAAPPPPAAPEPRPSIDVRALVRGWVGEVGQILARRAGDRYPLAARRAGLEGLVLLSIVVDERGRVLEASVRRSSGHAALDQAALAMVGEVGTVPAPPTQLDWEPRPLTVPVAYRLR